VCGFEVPAEGIHLFESGHFTLDERSEEYSALIKEFVLRPR